MYFVCILDDTSTFLLGDRVNDFIEIDFLRVGEAKSGDAISLRYKLNDTIYIHVIDGGFQETGETVENHINYFYGMPTFIDHVVATHPDGDHTGGLRTILDSYEIGTLWMLRPWTYADELIDRFSRFTNVDNLIKRLKELYPNIAELEKIATEKNIEIAEPFQGAEIGIFHVLAPSKERYLDLIVSSNKTPESVDEEQLSRAGALMRALAEVAAKGVSYIRAAWGEEVFSPEETSAENEMCIVQYAYMCDKRILLTADAGRASLSEAANFAEQSGLSLPGIDCIQVPHHGSRHNVSTEILDRWLGNRLPEKPAIGEELFSAIISAAKQDLDHPRKAVIRAFIHRGAEVSNTKNQNICFSIYAPMRENYHPVTPMEYPEDQED